MRGCEVGDELLFPIYYLAKDAIASRGQASLSELLGVPDDVYYAMRRELADPDTANADADDDDESGSDLWRDLAEWAFSRPDLCPPDPTDAQLELLLDEAGQKVPGLITPAAWQSAARYFEAENLHSLEGPASCRGSDLEDKLAAQDKG